MASPSERAAGRPRHPALPRIQGSGRAEHAPADGAPLAMPMWFLPDGDSLVMISVAGLRKVDNLHRDPRVCVVAEAGTRGAEIRNVTVTRPGRDPARRPGAPRARRPFPAAVPPGPGAPLGRPGDARRPRDVPDPARAREEPRRMSATPLSVYLPFNRDVIGRAFEPAKSGGPVPPKTGRWLLVQEQNLVVSGAPDDPRLPSGALPAALDSAVGEPLWLGTWEGEPVWTAALAPDVTLPPTSGARRWSRCAAPSSPTRCCRSAAWRCRASGGRAPAASARAAARRRTASRASGASAARAASTSTTRTCTPR